MKMCRCLPSELQENLCFSRILISELGGKCCSFPIHIFESSNIFPVSNQGEKSKLWKYSPTIRTFPSPTPFWVSRNTCFDFAFFFFFNFLFSLISSNFEVKSSFKPKHQNALFKKCWNEAFWQFWNFFPQLPLELGISLNLPPFCKPFWFWEFGFLRK